MCTSFRDLESQFHEKVNAWICAWQATDHDLASVILDEKEKMPTLHAVFVFFTH